jgi:hypothetical protein
MLPKSGLATPGTYGPLRVKKDLLEDFLQLIFLGYNFN